MLASEQNKTKIYEEFHEKVQGYIYSQVGDVTLAEDLCSDVFVKVCEKLESFDETKAKLSTWIFTITKNRLIDYYRTRKVFAEVPETYEDDASVEGEICTNESLEELANALDRLDERERDLIILHYYNKVTLKVIGEKLGISYAYVKVLHNKALDKLRIVLEM